MNRTLLIIIADFLLLSLLALARFDVPDAPDTADEPVESAVRQVEEDLIEILTLSLDAERDARAELASRLDSMESELESREEALSERDRALADRDETLAEREERLRRMEERAQRLEQEFMMSQEELRELDRRYTERMEEASVAQTRLNRTERELQERLEELERMRQTVETSEEQRLQTEEAKRRLETQIQVVETEKRLIQENLGAARQEIDHVRDERDRLQQQTARLAEGVTSLAERSGEITEQIRRNQPRTSNVIYSEYLENSLRTQFAAGRSGLFGAPVTRQNEMRTVLVTDGESTYALYHVRDTNLNPRENADWASLEGRLLYDGTGVAVGELQFLSSDPRIVVVPIADEKVEQLGVKVYPVALEPFAFPEAVLVARDGDFYGEASFRLNAEHPQYVRMERRIFNRLFGEYTPSTGDLVFSKTDELIGVMVNNEFCVLITNFLPAATLSTGPDLGDQRTGELMSQIRSRVERLPQRIRQ